MTILGPRPSDALFGAPGAGVCSFREHVFHTLRPDEAADHDPGGVSDLGTQRATVASAGRSAAGPGPNARSRDPAGTRPSALSVAGLAALRARPWSETANLSLGGDEAAAEAEIAAFARSGGGVLVESTPRGRGRNVAAVARAAQREDDRSSKRRGPSDAPPVRFVVGAGALAADAAAALARPSSCCSSDAAPGGIPNAPRARADEGSDDPEASVVGELARELVAALTEGLPEAADPDARARAGLTLPAPSDGRAPVHVETAAPPPAPAEAPVDDDAGPVGCAGLIGELVLSAAPEHAAANRALLRAAAAAQSAVAAAHPRSPTLVRCAPPILVALDGRLGFHDAPRAAAHALDVLEAAGADLSRVVLSGLSAWCSLDAAPKARSSAPDDFSNGDAAPERLMAPRRGSGGGGVRAPPPGPPGRVVEAAQPQPSSLAPSVLSARLRAARVGVFRSVLLRGACACVDVAGCEATAPGGLARQPWPLPCEQACARAVAALLQDPLIAAGGGAERLVLGNATVFQTQLRRWGGWGYARLRRDFLPRLARLGVPPSTIDALARTNAARLLAWWRPPPPTRAKIGWWACAQCERRFREGVARPRFSRMGFEYCSVACLQRHRRGVLAFRAAQESLRDAQGRGGGGGVRAGPPSSAWGIPT
jgi:predicted metal-dependent phosphotriesterase family hydrolase